MSEYWKSYWKNVHITDPQITVGRTKFGDPVSAKAFSKEITFINKKLKVSDKENLLDLCAGNGLISDFFCTTSKSGDSSRHIRSTSRKLYF